jgi:hypothetical protein
MALTIIMFFVLIALYVAMFGLVKFAETVIAKPQLAPLDNSDAPNTITAKSVKNSL